MRERHRQQEAIANQRRDEQRRPEAPLARIPEGEQPQQHIQRQQRQLELHPGRDQRVQAQFPQQARGRDQQAGVDDEAQALRHRVQGPALAGQHGGAAHGEQHAAGDGQAQVQIAQGAVMDGPVHESGRSGARLVRAQPERVSNEGR